MGPAEPALSASSSSSSSAPASDEDAFVYERKGARHHGCVFCGTLGHRIHDCTTSMMSIIASVAISGFRMPESNDGARDA